MAIHTIFKKRNRFFGLAAVQCNGEEGKQCDHTLRYFPPVTFYNKTTVLHVRRNANHYN